MDGINPLLAFALTARIIEITPGPNMTYLAALARRRSFSLLHKGRREGKPGDGG